MLYAGLDLSHKRLDFHLLDGEGATVEVGAAPPDADGLRGLSQQLERHREPIRAAIESKAPGDPGADATGRPGHQRAPRLRSSATGGAASVTAGAGSGRWR